MKLTDALKGQNPLTGNSIGLGNILPLIVGSAIILLSWTIAKNISAGVAAKIPNKLSNPLPAPGADPQSGRVIL